MRLAKLHRNKGDRRKAAQCYQRHLDALNVLGPPPRGGGGAPPPREALSLSISKTTAEALLFLAHYHKDAERFEAAIQCCSRLLEYTGVEKDEAKALMRDMRRRGAPVHI